MTEIRTKEKMYEMLLKGGFGNSVRMWNSLDELLASGFKGSVSMRYKGSRSGKSYNGKIGGGFVAYGIRAEDIPSVTDGWTRKGAEKRKIVINENPDDEKVLLQGEVRQPAGEPLAYLTYTCEKKKMRDAFLISTRHAAGLRADLIMRAFMWERSYEDMRELPDLYPDHTIEFGVYSYAIGNIPGRNTIIWEVRKY